MSPKRHWAVLETFLAIAAEEEVDPSIWWVETRDAAKHPTVHGTDLRTATAKNYLVPNVNCAEVGNPGL